VLGAERASGGRGGGREPAASPDGTRREPAAGGQPGAALLRLVEVMDRLRVECPWDARQTHESLAPHLLEECYEALEALETGDRAALRDELGDVLLQVVFHARVAAERSDGTGFTIDDVAGGIVSKLTRRHPHVFGDVRVSGPEEVKRNWDQIKAAERAAAGGGQGSALDSVPFGQPALALAAQLLRRAQRAGAPPELTRLPARTVQDSSHQESNSQPVAAPPSATTLDAATPGAPPPGAAARGSGTRASAAPGAAARYAAAPGAGGREAASDLGAELFTLVARAVQAGLDPEIELRAAARHYADLVRAWETGRGHRTASPAPATTPATITTPAQQP
jgi:XTP/dITP diphosphohydrolase